LRFKTSLGKYAKYYSFEKDRFIPVGRKFKKIMCVIQSNSPIKDVFSERKPAHSNIEKIINPPGWLDLFAISVNAWKEIS